MTSEPEPLNTEEIAIIRTTFKPLKKDLPGAGKLFYDTQFKDHPELLEKDFKGVMMVKQNIRLMLFMEDCIDALDKPKELMPLLTTCGERHGSYGTASESYPATGENLIKVLKIALGDMIDAPAEAAWRKLYAFMSYTMIHGQQNPNGMARRAKWEERQAGKK